MINYGDGIYMINYGDGIYMIFTSLGDNLYY